MVDVGVDGWLILELIFNKQGGRGGGRGLDWFSSG